MNRLRMITVKGDDMIIDIHNNLYALKLLEAIEP
jgi:hypothetical protein